jgi:hypothetical protein
MVVIGLCLAAGAAVARVPAPAFTLAWNHSIEKIRWEEDFRVRGDLRLELVEARVRGSGAGMEPPPGAVLRHGVWHYRPPLAELEELRLARSRYVQDYELCVEGACRPLATYIPIDAGTTTVTACRF